MHSVALLAFSALGALTTWHETSHEVRIFSLLCVLLRPHGVMISDKRHVLRTFLSSSVTCPNHECLRSSTRAIAATLCFLARSTLGSLVTSGQTSRLTWKLANRRPSAPFPHLLDCEDILCLHTVIWALGAVSNFLVFGRSDCCDLSRTRRAFPTPRSVDEPW
jgi:hypothetical protein